MSTAREIVERWWAAFEAGDDEALATMSTPDCEIIMPGLGTIGRQTLLGQVFPAYKAAFPDLHHETVDAIEHGDRVVVRLRTTMTHTGPFATPRGEVAATGRSVVLDSADVVTVSDGRITSWHAYFDQMSLLGQLGLLPQPAGA
ncbi:MAG: ester cyclase [Pseudonocardia sp.]|nr:ester cyclase [Pseudonocardia sp.]